MMESDADLRAPGAAITAILCGHWDHEPPCPVAPHHSLAHRTCGEVRVRILFAAEPDTEGAIRHHIELALSGGQLKGPDGVTTRWQLRGSQRSDLQTEEMDHAEGLIRT